MSCVPGYSDCEQPLLYNLNKMGQEINYPTGDVEKL